MTQKAYLSTGIQTRRAEGRLLKRLLAPVRQPVTLEVTEHRQIEDCEAVREALRDLPATVGLAIDDVGGVHRDDSRRAVVAGMVQFARTAGGELIAEGVELQAEHDALAELGVTYGQGNLYAAPAPLQKQ